MEKREENEKGAGCAKAWVSCWRRLWYLTHCLPAGLPCLLRAGKWGFVNITGRIRRTVAIWKHSRVPMSIRKNVIQPLRSVCMSIRTSVILKRRKQKKAQGKEMPQPLMQRAESRKTVPISAVRKAAVSQRYWTVTMSMTKAAVIMKRRNVAMSAKSAMVRNRRIQGRIPKIQKMQEQIWRNVSVRYYARRTASTGTVLCVERKMQTFPDVWVRKQ